MGTEYFDIRLPENNFHFLLWIRKHLWGHWTQSSVALELSQRMDHFNSFMEKKNLVANMLGHLRGGEGGGERRLVKNLLQHLLQYLTT